MKTVLSAEEAIKKVSVGDSVMVGGFGLVGCPLTLVEALVDSKKDQLTVISNNLGEQGKGLGKLVLNKQVKKGIGSYFTSNIDVVTAYKNKELDIELKPQGTLSEAIRSGGAGLGGFYTPVSFATKLGEGKDLRVIDGKSYVFEPSLTADVALVKALKADKLGNLVYRKTSRNFNPLMATAARTVLVEVEEIVEVGDLSAEEIVTPHLYVDYLILKEN